MEHIDTVIVGGGPAGSSAAWELCRHGRSCLVLDRQIFPRVKLCAGWVTPKTLADLAIDVASYPYGITRLDKLRLYFGKSRFCLTLPIRQWSIRRVEFDSWLLKRSGVRVDNHSVREIEFDGDRYQIDGKYSCDSLIGAGGTACPVRRRFFPPPKGPLIVTQENEYEATRYSALLTLWIPWVDGGYAWSVPKRNAVNVGYGMAKSQRGIRAHWRDFTRTLHRRQVVTGTPSSPPPAGWSYHLAPATPSRTLKKNGCYIVGDSAGLATRDLAEGIGPAVESGLLAARDVLGMASYSGVQITRYSLPLLGKYMLSAFLDLEGRRTRDSSSGAKDDGGVA